MNLPTEPGPFADVAPARRAAESVDPATGEVWKRYPSATPEVVVATVARAQSAGKDWAREPLALRVHCLRRFHDVLFRRRREIAELLTRENGKPLVEALGSEVSVSLDFASYYAAQAPGFLRAPWTEAAGVAMKRKRVRVTREPYGVIGILSPSNYPFLLSVTSVLPGIVTGNAVVLKPSEFTPTSGAVLGDLLEEAGLPVDVFSVIQGDGMTGAALCDASVDKIFFTGGVATGRRVAVTCAARMIPCCLELGGSDPAIVLADADVRHAASGIAWGRFSNAGQTCVAPKRVFVEAPAYDAFLAALADVVRALRIGAGSSGESDVGPVIRSLAVDVLAAQRDDALQRGAAVVAAATAPEVEGTYFPPMVLADVPPDSRVLREETFGPILPVVRVRDADEAVALANDSEFGLSASIWSRDTARAARLAERLHAGTVAINDVASVAAMVDVPHGGVKRSGLGRMHGIAGLEECVRTKATVVDRFGAWRQPWWFGYSTDHVARMDAYVRLVHSAGVLGRLGALPGVIRFLFAPRRPL